MTETEFQALFDSYQNSVRTNASDPIPQKIHLMVYNYALRRHQQSSDVSADFYLHMLAKLAGILNRYDPRRTPFYQYMAAHLNFEFSHFLRRRKLPRAQTELLSLEELATRRIELSAAPQGDENLAESLFLSLKTPQRIYARLALAFPLSFGELRQLIGLRFPADLARCGIFGHSMGGHGALTLALRHPELYRSVSAFAPIAAPSLCPWGQKAFGGYLGDNRELWRKHDAATLIEDGLRCPPILVDQGLEDQFLPTQLNPDRFEQVCADGQPLTLRRHPGYDHGYYFISTFIADHLAHHAQYLRA